MKVPFIVDPSFHGEHSFYLHGIHHIKTSPAFREWNDVNKVIVTIFYTTGNNISESGHSVAKACYFPEDKNLTSFALYSQENCLLECKLRRLSRICGCSPWFLLKPNSTQDENSSPICGAEGNDCIKRQLESYKDDLEVE